MAERKKTTKSSTEAGESRRATPKRSGSADAPKKKPAAAKPAAPKSEAAAKPAATKVVKSTTKSRAKKKPATTAAPTGHPMVDTGLAAQVAARALATRAKLGAAVGGQMPQQQQPAASAQPARESGSFKQLKENLNKPTGASLGNVLGNAPGSLKSNLPMHGRNESFHSQTQGAGPKFNVPRRTGG